MPEKPKFENAKTEIFRFWRFVFPHAPSNLVSPFGRDVAQRQRGLGSLVRELDLPQAKTEGVLQIDKIRMRLALIRIYRRAALSVICFANASSPKGRAEKPERTAHSRAAPFRGADKFSHSAFFYCVAVRVMV